MSEAMFKIIVDEPVDTPPSRVYLDFYQLSEVPFAITPDPEFLFSASCHQQVLNKIGYAIDTRMGFVLLTGEVGTGKTTLCRTLLDQLNSKADTVYVINPSVSGHELLACILEDLGMQPEPQASKKALIDQLNRQLLFNDTERPVVVIIDDAQTTTPETLEDLRLLSNLETDKRKLIQIVLSGQPELLDMLADKRLRQLKQRIAVHCRLEPLSVQETGAYISRRLFVAGNQGQVGFSHHAARLVHKTAGGIPRLINKICDYALTAGYVKEAQAIETSHVKQALSELEDLDGCAPQASIRALRLGWTAVILLLFVISAVFFSFRPGKAVELSTTAKAMSTVNAVIVETEENTVNAEWVRKKRVPSQPAPYALQLGSFRTLARAERGVARYRKTKVPAHWQMVENGTWWRIVAGRFETAKQAANYKQEHGLKDAQIIKAPWTIRLLPRQPDHSDTELTQLLSEFGYDSLMQSGLMGDNEIYTGLFVSVEDAFITAQKINRSGQLLAQVVTR